MTTEEIYNRLKQAADTEYQQWNKTRLSEDEKYKLAVYYLGGIRRAALFILPTDLYFNFTEYLNKEYGIGRGVQRTIDDYNNY